jgi:Tfp pilus assembly protein PilX
MMQSSLLTDNHGTQRGVALIVSLVMLVAITLIGVYVMGNSRLEWLMTSNSRFQSDADFRAYAAVRDGIAWVQSDQTHVSPPTPADLRLPSSWNLSSPDPATSITSPGTNQYHAEMLSCAQGDTPGGTPCDPSDCSKGNTCTYTYQVWARASDSKGTERIVRATVIKQEAGVKFLGLHATYAEIAP